MVTEDLEDSFEVAFAGLEDPRIERNKRYPLIEILFLVLAGAICGVDSWRGMLLFGEHRLDWLRKFFPYKNGIPSHQTIGRVFSLIAPKSFELSFIEFMKKATTLTNEEIIALDGKTLRRSFDSATEKSAIHMVNAWAVENGVALGQLEVDCKTNEIKAVPELLDLLDVKGAIVTADAMNCQKDIAKKIVEKKADYALAVKGNQGNLKEAIELHFDTTKIDENSSHYHETTEKAHGRIDTRTYECSPVEDWLETRSEWKGLKSVAKTTTNSIRNGKSSSETRYFILSFEPDAQKFARACRGHWGVENSLHWVLDMTFNEDSCRVRKDHAPRNFATIRKMALNILKTDKICKQSLKGRKMRAIMKPEYLTNLVSQAGFK